MFFQPPKPALSNVYVRVLVNGKIMTEEEALNLSLATFQQSALSNIHVLGLVLNGVIDVHAALALSIADLNGSLLAKPGMCSSVEFAYQEFVKVIKHLTDLPASVVSSVIETSKDPVAFQHLSKACDPVDSENDLTAEEIQAIVASREQRRYGCASA